MAVSDAFPLNWELDTLLPHPDSDAFREVCSAFRRELTDLAERSESLPEIDGQPKNVAGWVDFLQIYESITARAIELTDFIGCRAAADAQNKLFQKYEAHLSSLEPLREQIATNFEFALRDADAEEFAAFVKADEKLEAIEFYLRDRQRNAEMRLPKEQESLAADLAVDGIHAWGRLYDRISGSLRVPVMERGEIVQKSPGQVPLDSPQRAVRENNFFAAAKAWSSIADSCADALNHISGTRLTLYRKLGLRDHLESPLRHNRMRRETLDAMWNTVVARKSCLLKYLAAKSKCLGRDTLTWYDLQAPLPVTGASPSAELSYDAACTQVIESFSRFSPEFGEFARSAIEQRWIEVEDRPGKRQGGFCTWFPQKQESRIFMTYTNTPDSMSTLAHELGHAYHSHVLKDRPMFLQQYPMNLAETASTFAEAVLGERRLETAQTTGEKMTILDGMLGDAATYLMNIHARFLFEDAFHTERHDGELSAERLSELMLAAQKESFQQALDDDGWYENFWVSKLHFYITELPFYNFPYTFGYLLSLGVYALADEFGSEFPARYRQLLIATGCQDTEQAVESTLGYDLSGPEFWNKSLDVIEQRVEQFAALVASGASG